VFCNIIVCIFERRALIFRSFIQSDLGVDGCESFTFIEGRASLDQPSTASYAVFGRVRKVAESDCWLRHLFPSSWNN